jgi:hypothetical protein
VSCSLAVVATWLCPAAASALEIGPVSVAVPAPPPVTVTVPPTVAVGPVNVPDSQLAPGLGASVNVSPSAGVSVSVSLPSSVGPVPVVPVAPYDVQIALGPSGTRSPSSAAPPSATAGPLDVPRSDAQSSRSSRGTARDPQAGVLAARVPSPDGSLRGNSEQRARRVSHQPSIPLESQPGAVNASLQPGGSGGPWSLFLDLASGHGLWIALLLVVAVARLAAGGLLRDALRRRAHVIST